MLQAALCDTRPRQRQLKLRSYLARRLRLNRGFMTRRQCLAKRAQLNLDQS